MVPFHDQIRTVESAPPDTRKSPVLSNVTEWTASSWPTKVEIWEQELIVKSIQKIIEGCYEELRTELHVPKKSEHTNTEKYGGR